MRITIARHAETVYNAGGRMQGHMGHTPLTRAGIAQAEAMGVALAADEGLSPDCDIWASPSGRTLQTAAIIAEHLGRDFFDIRTDPRLLEIDVGAWQGRLYKDVVAEIGPIHCPDRHIFSVRPPEGEWYPEIAARLRSWVADLAPDRDVLVISHGVTLRVLRGLLAGGAPFEGVDLADDAPQGTIFRIEGGEQTVLHVGTGRLPKAA
ncbi:histidine phosphatase family protein [Sphingomonas sp. AP4-R1]|uniref:histidine phosphatase family protein n=1 Tax=Sphingomonas sp. AP4-R1 TaxID=2735134 RepID=UPI0014932D5A|nr:histidine phosphatase family protein [Sphingomonas sp. AP4-R1]QJU59868.1 histidine phosphatase family protein [Sphingomonas sp. AP4-R1]